MQKIQATLPNGVIVQDRYCVVDILGRGGFSAVYLVKDEQDGILFALKELIDQDKAERTRFTFECAVLERLDHPALPRVHRVFEENNRAYMLMDYVEGANLEVLRRKQPGDSFALHNVFAILEPIVSALSYLHSQQPPIIHRDIKPSNIIVPQEGSIDFGQGEKIVFGHGEKNAVLVDFGIAKEYNPDSTTTAIRHCSPGYGAPEQYALGTDLRTDIYGLGATFYALLTGTVPVDSLQRATLLGTQGIDPLVPVRELTPDIPQHVADVIQRAIAIGPKFRFNSMEEFWQAMNGKNSLPLLPVPQTGCERKVQESQKGQTGHDKAVPRSPITSPLLDTHPLRTLSGRQGIIMRGKNRPQPGVSNEEALLARHDSSSASREQLFRSPVKRMGLLVWLSLALLLVLAVGLGVWTYMLGTHPANTTLSATTTHITRTTLPTPSPSPAAVYPNVAHPYVGTVHDMLTNVSTSMTLTQVQQNGAIVKGTFNGLHETNPFNGVLDTSNHFFFTVAASPGHSAIFFQGNVRSDDTLVGNFCDVNAAGQCINDYGLWTMIPGQ